jgi:hypothetical protein
MSASAVEPDGQVKFHRHGRYRFNYGEHAGKFPPDRFSVLVLSDDRGAAIKDAAPPQR